MLTCWFGGRPFSQLLTTMSRILWYVTPSSPHTCHISQCNVNLVVCVLHRPHHIPVIYHNVTLIWLCVCVTPSSPHTYHISQCNVNLVVCVLHRPHHIPAIYHNVTLIWLCVCYQSTYRILSLTLTVIVFCFFLLSFLLSFFVFIVLFCLNTRTHRTIWIVL